MICFKLTGVVLLKSHHASELPEGLLEQRMKNLNLRYSNSLAIEWGSLLHDSNIFPGVGNSVDLETMLWESQASRNYTNFNALEMSLVTKCYEIISIWLKQLLDFLSY